MFEPVQSTASGMTVRRTGAADVPQLPAHVRRHLNAVVERCAQAGPSLVSLILFGSLTRAGFSSASDVDLIVVLSDHLTPENKRLLRDELTCLETSFGLRPATVSSWRAWQSRVERAVGHRFPCCVCTRRELLSGNVARILDLRRWEAPFVDRIVLASIVASAVTISGEDLISRIPVPRIRRLDVWKAFFAFQCQLVVSAALFPALEDATHYAMGVLKHSVHSCYFSYHRCSAPLYDEIAFFNRRFGVSRALVELLGLRRQYRASFGFIIRCFPTVASLHLRTIRDFAARQ